ncbi:hypothetical protein LMG8526_1701 [Lactococcus lactis subsp. lactis]|nr:hypothetical protein LMG8526_1701 [Lactococcus lactis subsp. lactis]
MVWLKTVIQPKLITLQKLFIFFHPDYQSMKLCQPKSLTID